MKKVQSVIIGGGQAGLAMSRALAEQAVEHVVLERGRVAERWRSERWESLRMLTPRWQSRLPGWSYRGPDPDGFMSSDEVVRTLESYANTIAAPLETGVTVRSVRARDGGFRVETDRGAWRASNVVIATGASDLPYVPPLAAGLSPEIQQVVPPRYRGPEALPSGGVLVVGASATGIQLAEEIHQSGRPVTLAVGRHTRLPRRYRGRDVLAWLDAAGVLTESTADVPDLERSRHAASLQLVGSEPPRTLDLGVLGGLGVRIAGRLDRAEGGRVRFAADLARSMAAADAKLARTLRRVDAWIERHGLDGRVPGAEPVRPLAAPRALDELDLRRAGIRSVLWATGYRREYPWLHVPVLDGHGEIRHEGGVTPVPGLYVLGLPFLRRRNSSFLDGVGADARDLAAHLSARPARRVPVAA